MMLENNQESPIVALTIGLPDQTSLITKSVKYIETQYFYMYHAYWTLSRDYQQLISYHTCAFIP
jgi:hypothetical protein